MKNTTQNTKQATPVATQNELVKMEEARKTLEENLTFASVAVEFKNSKFEKAITSKYFLSNEEMKNLKSELKVIKNIDNISNITIEEIAPNKAIKDDDGKTSLVCTAKIFHLNNFKNNAVKFTKNDFDKILAIIPEDTQLAIFRKVLLLSAKEKATSVKHSELALCGAKTLVKKFVIAIIKQYLKG